MAGSQMVFNGFAYNVVDGTRTEPDKEPEKVKLLHFKDEGGNLVCVFTFSLDEFETFQNEMQAGRRIISPP